MSETVIVAIVSGMAVVIAALLGTGVRAWLSLRNRADQYEAHNRMLWLYCRQLIDHIYRGKPPPPPPAPVGLFDREENNHG
jgi:hypothetical protein